MIKAPEIGGPARLESRPALADSPLVGSWAVSSIDPHGADLSALVTFHADSSVIAIERLHRLPTKRRDLLATAILLR
ncbi:MAG: hypothetical protein ACJ789_01465 [Thermomicrobiales bacterium]